MKTIDKLLTAAKHALEFLESADYENSRTANELRSAIEAVELERGADGYDFTDPEDNPYILSGEELARAETAARSR